MQCPSCKVTVPDGAKFCAECGMSLVRVCPTCGHANSARSKFCSECGANLAPAGSTILASIQPVPSSLPPGAAAERRQLTVMFCDLVGSTALATRIDPEDLGDVIRAFQRCVAETVTRFDGYVARYMGDGVLAYFGYPQAHEDDAERAVLVGLELTDAVSQLPVPERLQVRIGVNTGQVVVGELIGTGDVQERSVVGETPNLAARLQALAVPNTVVIGPETRRLLGNLFEYQSLGAVEVKGFAEPIRAFRVLGRSTVESRFEALHSGAAPLIGRDEEIGLLLSRWEQTKAGRGRVVQIIGEPGIGKSRLTRALVDRLADAPHALLQYNCSPYHMDSALHPIIIEFVRAAGIEQEDPPDQKLAKVEVLLRRRSKTLTDIVALVANMLSIPLGERYAILDVSPQRRRDRTLAALLDQVGSLARQQPVIMIFEDVHWIDPTTLELLSLIVEQIPESAILLIITARPEFAPPWPAHGHVAVLTLNRLDQREGEALVRRIAKGKGLPAKVLSQIMGHADGVPLFVEELTKTVMESGLLKEESDHYVLSGPLPPLAIPSTLHASLLARLDRLASAKHLAQIGATIGRDFSYRLIATVTALPERDLNSGLAQLVGAELLFQRGTPPNATYLFKHALVQDAAYASLVRSGRGEIHGAIVAAAESDTITAMEPSLLGYHCAQAGLVAKAASYYRIAGQQSAAHSAGVETRAQLERGLQFALSLAPGAERNRLEAELLLALGHVLLTIKGNADVEALAVFESAVSACRKLDSPEALTRALFSLATIVLHRGDARTAQAIAEEILTLGDAHREMQISLAALVRLGQIACFQGRFDVARDSLSQALALCAQGEGGSVGAAVVSTPAATAAAHFALSLACLGHTEQATAQTQMAIQNAKKTFPSSIFLVLTIASPDDNSKLRNIAESQVAVAREQGFPYFHALARCLLGWLTAKEGDADGLHMLSDAVASLSEMGIKSHGSWARGLMCDGLACAGRQSEALAGLDEAIALSTSTGVTWFDAELHRRKGELLFRMECDPASVEHAFRQAILVARNQSAKLFELRSVMGLAEFYRSQRRHAEAREFLAPICELVTEGFDLPRLKEAKALLNQLSQ